MSEETTAGRAWRQAATEGVVVTMQSGKTVRMRSVPIDRLIMTGELPDILTPLAAKVLWNSSEAALLGKDQEQAKQYIELCNKIIPLALLDPVVVDNPTKDGEVSIWQIPLVERSELLTYAMQPTEVLAAFRSIQAGDVAALPHSEGDEQPPI